MLRRLRRRVLLGLPLARRLVRLLPTPVKQHLLAMGGLSGIHRYQDFRDPTAHPLQRYQQVIFLNELEQQLENTSTTTLTLSQGMVSHSDFTILEFQ